MDIFFKEEFFAVRLRTCTDLGSCISIYISLMIRKGNTDPKQPDWHVFQMPLEQ
jgi:hypothetical protein